MKYTEIPKFTDSGSYTIDIEWSDLQSWIGSKKGTPLDLDPDYQREYVWTEDQEIAYVEYILKGGISGKIIYLNCPSWMKSFNHPLEVVDGKQRLTSVLKFLNNKITAFGIYRKEYEGIIPSHCYFTIKINKLKRRYEILNWYLELNTGGTVHTQEELGRVRNMMKAKLFYV